MLYSPPSLIYYIIILIVKCLLLLFFIFLSRTQILNAFCEWSCKCKKILHCFYIFVHECFWKCIFLFLQKKKKREIDFFFFGALYLYFYCVLQDKLSVVKYPYFVDAFFFIVFWIRASKNVLNLNIFFFSRCIDKQFEI